MCVCVCASGCVGVWKPCYCEKREQNFCVGPLKTGKKREVKLRGGAGGGTGVAA